MGLFSPTFMKPGKGIDKDEPQLRSFFRFFDVFFRKFWHIIRLNLIYALTMLPTFVIVFLLAGLVADTFFAMEKVQNLLQSMARQGAEYLNDPQTFEYEFSRLIVTFDLSIRFFIAFTFTIFWGMGPASAGFHRVLRSFSKEEHAWVWSDFKDAVKDNLKQALIVYLIDVLAFVIFFIAFLVYGQMPGPLGTLRYVILMLLFVYTLMHQYLYPIMVTFDLKLKDIYRNAMLFAVGKLPSNLFVFLLLALIHFGSVFLCIQYGGAYTIPLLGTILVLELFVLLSFSGLLVNFNTYPKIKKYMIDPLPEQD